MGVWLHGAADCDVPEMLDKYADAVVGWNTDRILDAIDGKTSDWECSDGSPRLDRKIKVYNC